VRRPPTILTKDEVLELFRTVGDTKRYFTPARMQLLLGFLYRHGLRISEALALEVEDLDFDRHLVFVRNGKGGKQRTVGFDRTVRMWALEFLRRYKVQTGRIFFTRYGRPWRKRSAYNSLRKIARRTSITKRVYPHAFRHTYAWELAMEQVSMPVIQKLLGHTNLQVTSIYLAHVAPELLVQTTENREWAI
jgi:site-specific recombinase XerD